MTITVSSTTPFASEAEMVDAIRDSLLSCKSWRCTALIAEFDFSSGRTDLVGLSNEGTLFAFEAKLRRWRDALQQAYRATSYAHTAFVVVPETVAVTAMKHREQFERHAVGLCQFKNGQVTVLIPACAQQPLFAWLANHAMSLLESSR